MLVADYGKHKEMDGWMECDRVSMCGHDSGRGEVRRLAIQVVVNHLLMRPPVISGGRRVRKASSGARDAAAVTSPAAAKTPGGTRERTDGFSGAWRETNDWPVDTVVREWMEMSLKG